MAEITFTRAQVVTLLARSFTRKQLADGKYHCPTLREDYDDCGGLCAHAHWWSMLNDAQLGDCPGSTRD
jgi:hypothetical protein